ncbi:hypothetical protein PRIC1_005476 [Phytophthora ramorum]
MDPFQVSPFATSQPSKPPLLPQDALMVVDNRQLQVWSGINCWPPHPQDPQRHGTAATLMGLTASSAETPSTSASTSPVTEKKKKRVFKKRKATHTVRKEQKAALAKEIEQLQAQLDEIKFQALVQQGQASRSYHDRVVENAVLRESIQDQHLAMAQVRALLSTHTQHHMSGVRPMETKICLSADRAERRGVLHALRETKLRDAKRFLRARSNGINTNTPPLERVRRDATAAMLITSYVESTAKGEGELVVAVTRWSCARICHTDLNVSREAMLDIQQSAILSQGTFLNCVRETLGLPATTT